MTRYRLKDILKLLKQRKHKCKSRFRPYLEITKIITIVLEKTSAVSIDVWIWVFNLSDFAQNAWNSFEADSSQITNVVVLDVSVSEFLQMHESWVSVSQDGMSVTWNDSTFSESFVNELLNDGLAWSLSLVEFFKFHKPFQAFLVS